MFMKNNLYLLLFCTFWLPSKIIGQTIPKTDSISVYIFLDETCVISQYYTLSLKALNQEFGKEHLQFIGLFPNFSSKPAKIKTFKKKYKIPFELKTDYYHSKVKQLGAEVTPEVVVYNETSESILYKGRIDNTYFRIGKRRNVTTTHDLKAALVAIRDNQPIPNKSVLAVGCFIHESAFSND